MSEPSNSLPTHIVANRRTEQAYQGRGPWPRVQLIELNDQAWLPRVLRNGIMRYLQTILDLCSVFSPLAGDIAELVEAQRVERIVDLGSGSGGPYPRLAAEIATAAGRPVRVMMTDLFPNEEAYTRIEQETAGLVAGAAVPIDAGAVPGHLRGLRTMFDAFHHLPPDRARAVLLDAVRAGDPILVAEGNTRSLANLLGMLLVPLVMWSVTPWIRPLSISQILFTYLIPLLPLIATFDGFVSVLRTYRSDEMLALARSIQSDYVWKAGTFRYGGRRLPYLLGMPEQEAGGVAPLQ